MQTAEQLLESGVQIPDDPVAIARLLDGSGTAAPPTPAPPETPPADPPKDVDEPPPTPETPPPTPPPTPPVEDEEKGPPRALLRTYRTQIHDRDRQLEEQAKRNQELEQEIAALKSKATTGKEALQEAADALGTDTKLEGLTPEKIEELRREHSDAIVDVLVGYAKGYETLQEQVEALTQQREQTELDKLYNDIDSVPLLGVLRLDETPEGNARWQRVLAYQKAVNADPDFIGKSRVDVFGEIARRMEGHLGQDVLKTLLGDKAPAKPTTPTAPGKAPSAQQIIDEALDKARKSSVPTSLSDIPAAGGAVAQSGQQRLESMSNADLQALMEKWIASGKNPDELIAKLLTS